MTDRETRLLTAVTIADVLSLIGYPWGLTPDRTHQLRCPVHEDRSPSARYYHEQQKIHCFTCGTSWDAIGLVAAVRHTTRSAAMALLEEEFPTAETAETLVSQLKAQLRAPGGPDVGPLLADTERRLIGRRRLLSCEVYSRRLQALDLLRYRVAHETLPVEAVPALCHRLLEAS